MTAHPNHISGEMDMASQCEYFQDILCHEDCTGEIHDDCCLLGFVERVRQALPVIKEHCPEAYKAQKREVQPWPAYHSEPGFSHRACI